MVPAASPRFGGPGRSVTFGALVVCAILALASARAPPPARRPPPSQKPKPVKVLIIFGDSATDQGRVFAASNGTAPDPKAYYQGRFSNGPNWVDYLTTALQPAFDVRVFNYAFGGAYACPNAAFAARFPFVSDLGHQNLEFLADKAAGRLPATGDYIFIQFVGTNDVAAAFGAYATQGGNVELNSALQSLIYCRIEAMRQLFEQGGAKNVVVAPLAPLEYSPGVPPQLKNLVAQLVDGVDTFTGQAVFELQLELNGGTIPGSPNVTMLGSNNDFQLAVELFANTTNSCIDNANDPSGSTLGPNPNVKVCADPNSYFLYNALHPNTLFQKWLALSFFIPRLQALGLLPAAF